MKVSSYFWPDWAYEMKPFILIILGALLLNHEAFNYQVGGLILFGYALTLFHLRLNGRHQELEALRDELLKVQKFYGVVR